MKSHGGFKAVVAGLTLSLVGAATGLAASSPPTRTTAARVSPASSRSEAKKTVAFKTDKTDSWLCNYVSPFFCTSLFPTLDSHPDGAAGQNSAPARGRN